MKISAELFFEKFGNKIAYYKVGTGSHIIPTIERAIGEALRLGSTVQVRHSEVTIVVNPKSSFTPIYESWGVANPGDVVGP